jgi:aspartyl-tRNA(Asn)/glutamyl-tRNA(Gln) amidotransferase subunit A
VGAAVAAAWGKALITNPEMRSVAELAQGYRDGSLTPVDVVEAALARLHEREPALNAFADAMAAAARADAATRTAELQAGRAVGPLHGIPVAIKDLIDVAGVETGYGTRAVPPRLAVADAELVRRLRAAGAIIVGKTNLLEFAYGVPHPAIGQTNNPHDPGRTAGGSSGGSAAAVADGIVPLAVGTDTGGSIRIPAAYCGIVGLKPSFGLVPLDGVFPLSPSLDHAGPLARSVADAATLLEAMAGALMSPPAVELRGLKIGIVGRHWHSSEIAGDARRVLEAARVRLERAGAVVRDIAIDGLERANRELIAILLPEAALIHEAVWRANPSGYAPHTGAQIEAGFQPRAVDYLRAMRFRDELRAMVEAAFTDVDVLLSPSVPFVAPETDPVIHEGEEGEMLASGFANVSGHPAISIPCGRSGGLPLGVQLVGRLDRDRELLGIAAACEAALA